MTAAPSAASVVLDHTGLDLLAGVPTDANRLVCVFQPSPDRVDALRRRFPRAEVVVAPPTQDGPWQAWVEEDLRRLRATDVLAHGVPFLDAFRAALRDDLTLLRAIEWGLGGRRRVTVAMRDPALAILEAVRDDGHLDDVVALGETKRRPLGMLGKLRRANARGIAMALTSRLDPTGSRRARFRRRLRVGPTPTVLVSSYVNPTRAVLEAHAALGVGAAVLVETGPGASRGLALPPGVVRVPVAAAITLDPEGVGALRASCVPQALDALSRWTEASGRWPVAAAMRRTSLGAGLARVHLPEIVTAVGALAALVHATGARRILVGDEFSFVDRAALHLGRALGLETVARQHGVLDSHYIRDRVLADRYLAWDAATIAWLERRGALGDRRAEVVPRKPATLAPRAPRARHVVVFLQPFQMIGIAPRDWLAETLPVVVRVAAGAGLETVLKPHPLQSAAEVRSDLPESVRDTCRLVTDRSARDLLAEAAVAITLDSSVAVDCREAGVPCLSTGWYAGTYLADLSTLGYVESATTPSDLGGALTRHLAQGFAR